MGRVAVLFPGQGAQIVGMGRILADKYPEIRRLYAAANEILGCDITKLCFHGPAEELDSTAVSQPAIFLTALAALEVLKIESPDVLLAVEATAGLSLGEYTALVFAGTLSFEDGLKLVQKRGRAMQDAADATPGGMVSILGLERCQVEELCDKVRGDGTLQIANLLCPGNIVISGTNDACERAAELAAEMGAMKAVPLAVAGAFHTQIMQPVVAILSETLAKIELKTPTLSVISNVDARPHSDQEEIRAILIKQVVQPVLWETSMQYLIEQGFDTFYEVGPGRVLRGLLRRIDRKAVCHSVEVV
ncbi:MAG: ACP S-malonyltransferase [Planctomycetaceae bacterium]|nr:ACP S-malonyltransferase [Planctomycetaceae bacterium]